MLKNFDTNLIHQNDHLLLAVSGGIDSMVMLHYLGRLTKEMSLTLTVVHLDHQKRKESFLDCQLVSDTCEKLSIACYTEKLPPYEGENFHDYAHQKRYEFFLKTARAVGANKIVLAHNADDLAETVLMRLVRGSSFEGYRGMLKATAFQGFPVIRPMLDIPRSDIVEYQKQYSVAYNEDQSNVKDDYTRNRYRHHVMPLIEKENPRYREKLAQFSEYQALAFDLVERLAETYLARHLHLLEDALSLDVSSFCALDGIVQLEVIKRVVNRLTKNTVELSFINLKDIRHLFDSEKPHMEWSLATNLYIHKSYDKVHFRKEKPSFDDYRYVVDEPQEVPLPDGSLVIMTTNPNKYYGIMYKLCYNNLDLIFPLVIRSRLDGDRVQTASGTKKLKDLLIDKKVPMTTRNSVPVILDNQGRILWVPRIHKATSSGNQTLYIIYQEGNKDA